jgi:hypothetical protein
VVTEPVEDQRADRQAWGRVAARCGTILTHPAALVVAPLVAVAIVQLVRNNWFVPKFDFAIQELAVQDAVHGVRLLGPYSRFGFNHPGPMMFYAVVPWYEALGNNGGLAMVMSRLTVDAACLALIVVLVDRIGGRTAAWGAAAGLAWFELRAGLEWFRDPWNPFAVVLPTALALVAAAALVDGRGRRWRLVVFVLAASFAVQSHIGTTPLVLLALVVALFGVVRSARTTDRPLRGDLVVAGVVAVACWALPIFEQLTSSPGNLRDIYSFFVNGPTDRPGFSTVIDPVTAALTLPVRHMGNVLGPEPLDQVPDISPFWWCVAALLVATAAVYCVRSWRADRAGMAALAALVPLGFVAAIAAGLQIRGDVSPYLFAPALSVGLLAWATAGAAIAELVAERVRVIPAQLALAGTAIALTVGTLWVGSTAFDAVGPVYTSTLAADLAPGVTAVCRTHRPVRLVTESAIWYDYLSVGAEIGECAPDVTFSHFVEPLVGDDRSAPTDGIPRSVPKDAIRVRLETPAVPVQPGWRRVGESPSASLDLQLPGSAP